MEEREQALILLTEDRQDDVLLVLKAFSKANISNPVQVVWDGEEAIAYLEGRGKYGNRAEYPLPALVLLDLKLPKVDGFEVLQWIRNDPGMKAMRVIVLTSSQDMRDVNRAYELGANSFLTKPADFNALVELCQFLNDYWVQLDRAPESTREDGASKRELEGVRPMQVFVQSPLSGRYYAGGGKWTEEQSKAMDFGSVENAEAAVASEELGGVDIVLSFERPACDVHLPRNTRGTDRD